MAVVEALKAKVKGAGISGGSTLRHNFRRYGIEFGTYDYNSFVQKARKFYRSARESTDDGYSIVEMSRNRVAVDYEGKMRGVYHTNGEPIAFFKPDYRYMGYDSRQHELEDFRSGKSAMFV